MCVEGIVALFYASVQARMFFDAKARMFFNCQLRNYIIVFPVLGDFPMVVFEFRGFKSNYHKGNKSLRWEIKQIADIIL